MNKRVFIALRMAGIAGQEKLCGIFRYLGDRHDWDITLIRTAAEFTPERVKSALANNYDGYIVSIPDTEKSAALLAGSEVPTVVMDLHDPGLSARKQNIVFIRNSAKEIGVAAANHLLSMGTCRSYAFIHNASVMEWSVHRHHYFMSTLKDNGFWCYELKDPDGLASLEKPVGVFAANDDRGYDVIEYCHAHHLRIPEDVVVLGINNDILICEHSNPKLSSIQPDFEQEGFIAARRLDEMMRGEKPAELIESVGVRQIVRRESSAALSQSGKLVQKALAFIRKNALKGISVDDVARHVKVSRRLIDLRFRELQGTTIGETIISLRLEQVKKLLRSTKEPIDSIAAACGYENPNYLKNLFKKRFAMSMRDFRRQYD